MNKLLLIVFAKAPIKGEVKIRLGKTIEMEKSKWVYIQLLHHTAKVTRKSKIDTILFENQASKELHSIFYHSKQYLIQEGINLGNKMEAAFRWAFKQDYKKVILIGSDLWTLNEETLFEADHALEQNDFVIGPSYDGGYFLIGMKKFNPKVFKNIPWSTNQVLKETILKIKNKSIYFLELANDIDDLNDLKENKSLYNKYLKKFS